MYDFVHTVKRPQPGPLEDFQPIRNRPLNKEMNVRTLREIVLFLDWLPWLTMRDMRGRSRFRQLSITFSISRNAIGQSLLWKFAGELHWKKMASTSERKVGCVCFQFCSLSHSFKEKNERDWGRDGGKNKMANVLTQTVGEAKLFSDT